MLDSLRVTEPSWIPLKNGKLHLFFIGIGKLWEAFKKEYPDFSTALEYCFIAVQKKIEKR